MTSRIKYLDPFFDLMGNEDRRIIMFALHGSEYLRHHEPDDLNLTGCLKTSMIANILGKERSNVLYHLRKLEEGGLVERISRLDGRLPVLMWSVTDKWVEFIQVFDLDKIIREYLEEKYSSLLLN